MRLARGPQPPWRLLRLPGSTSPMVEDRKGSPDEVEIGDDLGSGGGGKERHLLEPRVSEQQVSELSQARQRAQDALLRARLEGRSARAVALARQRAQRAADLLLAARLAQEQRVRIVSGAGRRRGGGR
jgi:hypothetical protein